MQEVFDSTTHIDSLRETSRRSSRMVVQFIGLNEVPQCGIGLLREFDGEISFKIRPILRSGDDRSETKGEFHISNRFISVTLGEAIKYPMVYIEVDGREGMKRFIYDILAKAEQYNLSYGRVVFS